MKIFVTGATGFLGRAFCRAAAASGHEVLALCRAADAGLPEDCRVLTGSLEEIPWPEVERFAPEAALHLAWLATPGVYLQSPLNDSLVSQSDQLFQGLIRSGAGFIAGTGTCIEYAPSPDPLREDVSPIAPTFPYSRAKVTTWENLQALSRDSGVAVSWLRVFYPYGEGEHPGRMPSALIRKLSAGEVLELRTPDSVKDYIHVTDAAAAMLTALEHRIVGAVNIGTGTGVRIFDLAKAIAVSCGSDPDLVRRAATLAEDAFPVTVADTAKLSSAGWRTRVTLAEGVGRLRESLRLS